MRGEGLHDVEFYAGVAGKAVEGEVGVPRRVVVCGVVYDAGGGLGRDEGGLGEIWGTHRFALPR